MNRTTFEPWDNSKALIGIKDLFAGTETLSGTRVLSNADPSILKLDPGGASRDVTLDAEATSIGKYRRIINAADAAENLVCKDADGNTIGTINQNEQGEFFCGSSGWALIVIATIALS